MTKSGAIGKKKAELEVRLEWITRPLCLNRVEDKDTVVQGEKFVSHRTILLFFITSSVGHQPRREHDLTTS
jgi:hypothetical protein